MIPHNRAVPHPRSAVVAVSAGVFCVELDSFAFNLVLLRIGEEFPHGLFGPQWTITAYLLSVGALMLGAGRASDRFGRRRCLVAGLCLFGAASAACAVAPTLPALVAARAVQGAGAALLMPSGLALLTGILPAASRSRATGWALAAGGVGMACGPFVGGLLAEWASWRVVFWLNVPISVLAAVWASRAPESAAPAPCRVDVPGLVLATAALGVLAVWVDRLPGWGWSWTSVPMLLLFLLLDGLFVRRERAVAEPLIDPGVLRVPGYLALTVGGSVANAATVVFLLVVPMALQGPFGLNPGVAGLAFLVPSTLMSGAAAVAGRVPSSRAVAVMAACLGGASAAFLATGVVDGLPAALIAFGGCAVTLGIAKTLVLVATQDMVGPDRAGTASGVTKTVVTVVGGLSLACVTSGVGTDLAAVHAVLAAGCAVAAAILVVVLYRAG